jgi:nuclear pore complex protein Nup155
MTTLVNSQIDKQAGIEAIVNTLQQRCPNICENNDVILFKGIELLKSSQNSSNADEQNKFLREALGLFQSVLKTIPFSKLAEIVESFRSLEYYTGVVDLVLLWASFLEPVGVEAITTDNPEYYKRLDCYELLFATIAEIDQKVRNDAVKRNVISRALRSGDQIFHFCLYEWYIAQGWVNQLLEVFYIKIDSKPISRRLFKTIFCSL